ncbi:unnamed protein product [Caenorhabditis brenneri]
MRFGLPRDSNGDSDSDMPRKRSNFPKTPTVEVNVKAMDSTVLATLEDIRGKVDLLVQAQGLVQAQETSSSSFAKNDLERERMEHQATLSKLADTDSKLTGLSQELTAVRKDFEEYKATNDAKWETMEQRMAQKRQAEDSGVEGPAAKARGPLGTSAKPYKFSAIFTPVFDTAGSSIKAKSPSGRLLDRATKPKSPLGSASKRNRPSGSVTKPSSFKQAEEPSYPATESDSGSLDEFDIVSEAGESSGLANGPKAFSGFTTEPVDRATKAEAFGALLFRAEQELGLSTEPKDLLGLSTEPKDLLGLTDEPEDAATEFEGSVILAQDPSAQPNRPSGLTTEPKDPSGSQAKPKAFSGLTTKPEDPAARPKVFSAPPTQAEETSDTATEHKDTSGSQAESKALSGPTTEPSSFPAPPTQAQEPSIPAPPPQDPLTQKIADLEAALHSKTSQISKMEQEHKETVLLMSEQLENIYERLNPDSQALDPQEVRDARIETLEERNQELQSIIQANAEEVERAQTQRDGAHAVLLAENYDLKADLKNLKADLKKANETIESLRRHLQTERVSCNHREKKAVEDTDHIF